MPKDMTPEELRTIINKELPKDMRVFSILNVPWSFNAKHLASNREYSYYLPTFMLQSIQECYLGHPIDELIKKEEEEQANRK